MTTNVTTFFRIGDIVTLIDYEKNELKCDNWNYDELIDEELTGMIVDINYGTNTSNGKTKTTVELELDEANAMKVKLFRDKQNGKIIVRHNTISLTNPIFALLEERQEYLDNATVEIAEVFAKYKLRMSEARNIISSLEENLVAFNKRGE